MDGIQTWKTQLISSQEKENETSEPVKNIAITTRSNTEGRVSLYVHICCVDPKF